MFIKRFLILFVPVALICIAGAVSLLRSETLISQIKKHSAEVIALEVGVKSIERIVQSLIIDLTYLSKEDGFLRLLNKEPSVDYDHPADWPVFGSIKGGYDQIRWLDIDGQEQVRVNFNNGNPVIIPKEKLQNKGDRYYFTNTIKLEQGEFFISPLDLNIENEQIEQPIKPILRIAAPIFDNEGKRQGIVILNYLGEIMLNDFSEMMGTTQSQAWIVNRNGYWLKGPSKELEWGFMYQRSDTSMSNNFAIAWEAILSDTRGQFENEYGLWTFNTITPLAKRLNINSYNGNYSENLSKIAANEYFWKAVLFQPKKEYLASFWRNAFKLFVATSILLGLMFIGCWKLAAAWGRIQNAEEEMMLNNIRLENTVIERTAELMQAKGQAEQLARTDELTGMNNRRSFFEHGAFIEQQSNRNDHTYAIIMLDIDYFKMINDTYSHQTGDKVLVSISDTITEIIRATDIPARIGGEEFCIILPETTDEYAKILSERLRQTISEIVIPQGGINITVTASFGIAMSTSERSTLEQVMANADSAMYQAKKQGRNRAVMFREDSI